MKNQSKPNRLINSDSPYLLKHAFNPVDWREWGPEALEKARAEGKLIFLSIGYTACHWCNELEKECFDQPDFAEELNRRFVPIKVDRELRPDLDVIYMNAAMALQGGGGWPNNVFLTPDLNPLFAVGYRKREEFKRILAQVDNYWRTSHNKALEDGKSIRAALAAHLERGGRFPKPARLDLAELNEAMDPEYGGFGDGAKFPMASVLEFLLTEGGADPFLVKTLDNMSRGGMFDHVGGGFHRYTTDREWTIPHFEKMLYDNALLAALYAKAGYLLNRPDYARVAVGTLDFIHRELRSPEGGYLSSLDADSDGEEGKYYLWTLEEFISAGGDAKASAALGISPEGNMYDIVYDGGAAYRRPTGQSVIRLLDDERRQETLGRLMTARDRRPRPALDDKAVASWHCLAVSAFARAGAWLNDRKQAARAVEGAAFIRDRLGHAHSWRGGKAWGRADLDDTAYAAMAFWDMFEITGEEDYLSATVEWADYAHNKFAAGDGGYYMVEPLEDNIARPRARDDNPLPCSAAVLGQVELRLAVALGQPARRARAQAIADHLLGAAGGAGVHSGQAMILFREAYAEPMEIALALPAGEESKLEWLQATYGRRWGSVRIPLGAKALDPTLSEGRYPSAKSAAYVCSNGQCLAPAHSPAELASVLTKIHR